MTCAVSNVYCCHFCEGYHLLPLNSPDLPSSTVQIIVNDGNCDRTTFEA